MYPLNATPGSMNSMPSSAGLSQPQNAMEPRQQFAPASSMATMPNAYAHGGRTKRGKLVMAHFNPKELDVLDHLQGKIEKCPRSGMRSYTHLEELLKNPHILSSVHQHARAHHASGGSAGGYGNPSLNAMAGHGVHGDSELALIGPHTNHVLSSLAAPGTLTNHIDGRPQYWSLGGTLGGLWNTIKSGAQQAAPYIGAFGKAILPAAMPAIQGLASRYGGDLGAKAAEGLGGLANQGLDYLQGMGSDQNQAIASGLGQGLQAGVAARQAGMSPIQSAGAGVSKVGSMLPGAFGGGLQSLGGSVQQGRGLLDTAKNTAMGMYQGAGGTPALQNIARGAASDYSAGTAPKGIAQNAGRAAYNAMMGQQQQQQPEQEQLAQPGFQPSYQ
jgi:hypothetical protein